MCLVMLAATVDMDYKLSVLYESYRYTWKQTFDIMKRYYITIDKQGNSSEPYNRKVLTSKLNNLIN